MFGFRIMANIAVLNDCQKNEFYRKSLTKSAEKLSSTPYTPSLNYSKYYNSRTGFNITFGTIGRTIEKYSAFKFTLGFL